jgi:cytochrome b subunit of formate dehydrogenase
MSASDSKIKISPLIAEDEVFERMSAFERVQHLSLIIAFVLLALTGFPLLLFSLKIVRKMFRGESAFQVRSLIHRAAAVVLIVTAVIHTAYVGLSRRGRQYIRDMKLRAKDFRDAVQSFGHGLGFTRFLYRRGLGRKFFARHPYWLFKTEPLADRYGFVEKFEYWSLVLGSLIMIVSGFFMWRVDISLRLFPLWLHQIFVIVHSYEATLAVLAVLIWHMYHAHLRPEVFPMSRVWLDGKIIGRELRLRHPLEYLRIHEERVKTAVGKKRRTRAAAARRASRAIPPRKKR